MHLSVKMCGLGLDNAIGTEWDCLRYFYKSSFFGQNVHKNKTVSLLESKYVN